MDFMREQITKAEDMVANTTNWIKEVAAPLLVEAHLSSLEELQDTLEDNPLFLALVEIVEINLFFRTLGFVMELVKAAVTMAICGKDVAVNMVIFLKDVFVDMAICIKEATTNSLGIEMENPFFFSLLGIFTAILCLVSYFIYSRLGKNSEGKIEKQEEEDIISNPNNSSSTSSSSS